MCSASAEFEDFVLQFMDRYVEFWQVIHQQQLLPVTVTLPQYYRSHQSYRKFIGQIAFGQTYNESWQQNLWCGAEWQKM